MADEQPFIAPPPPDGFWVGSWFVDPRSNSISNEAESVRVEPKVMGVLECLAGHPGRTVPKHTFMEEVWEGTVVTDDVLARCISQLRKVFNDDPRNPRFIETIRKRGYRLIAPISGNVDDSPTHNAHGHYPPSRLEAGARPLPGASLPAPPAKPGGRVLARYPIAFALVGLILILLAAFALSSLIRSQSRTPFQTVPFTSLPGEEIDPALSPDGEFIVFGHRGETDSQFDLYVKPSDAESLLRLTDDPDVERSPTWAPDGRQVAFIRQTGRHSRIVTVPLDGGPERVLADLGNSQVRRLAWSPTGETLALTLRRAPSRPFRIAILSIATLDFRVVTSPPDFYRGDVDLAFAPEGARLGFIRSVVEGNEDLYVLPLDDTADSAADPSPERLTNDHAEISGLDWTADGGSIVFASNRDGSSSLWRVGTQSGATPEWIASAGKGGELKHPSVARLASGLIYAEHVLEINIWQTDRTETTTERLISTTQWDSHPQLSPDDERIAFTSDRTGRHEIWVSERDGSRPVQRTFFENAFTGVPRWSHDGELIAFEARLDDNADIYIVDADDGEPRQLTSSDASDAAPAWSHDGAYVFFASNRSGEWNMWMTPVSGNAAYQVTQYGALAGVDSPDGSLFFYVKADTTGIWALDLKQLSERYVVRQLVDDLDPADWANWTVTEDGIYYLSRDDNLARVKFYDFAGERSQTVLELEGIPEHPSLSVSSDGQWFVHSRIDRNESDVILLKDFR